MVIVLPLFASLGGCVVLDEDYGDTAASAASTALGTGTGANCVLAATSGGDGGPGGLLSIGSVQSPLVDGTIHAVGGAAGNVGQSFWGPPASAGDEGIQGSVEMLTLGSYQFDASQVAPGSAFIVGVAGQGTTLTSSGSEAALSIAVERFEVGPDAQVELGLSRVTTIVARQFVIAAGGRVALRDRGDGAIVVNTGGDAFSEPGLAGGTTTIWADEVVIDGTLDAAGNSGGPGQRGGLGGHLIIRTRALSVGANGTIVVDGGRGGDGVDEKDCDGL